MSHARSPCGGRWLAVLLLIPLAGLAQARDDVAATVAAKSCAALRARVAAVPGAAPLLLRSYDGVDGGEPAAPALRTAAFVYDEALVTVALIACGDVPAASRVGEALRLAATGDTRLRNVYRAGAVDGRVLRNGWWDAAQQRWVEDAYQVGTTTGNVAWTALALLALHDVSHEAKWLDAARGLARWVVANTADPRGAGGFRGGVQGFDAAPETLAWKSTEHALDLLAMFERLAAVDGADSAEWQRQAAAARAFLDAQWDERGGYLRIGTAPDGATPNRMSSALDVQLWAQLVPRPPARWARALAYAERAHGVDCGFDFDADRDGVWLEGTAQAALAYRVRGERAAAQRRLACVAGEFSPGGLLYATREARISTGLGADAAYFRWPHLGATAWAALAATGRNPYAAAR